jgi:hypothetical protein
MPQKYNQQKIKNNLPQKKNNIKYVFLFLLVLISAIFLIRPGIYSIQPTNAIPDGMTALYILRDSEVPFYTSLHPECFYSPTSVSLICNVMVKSALADLSGRIILKLPYYHAAYLKGSNGIEPGHIED